MKTCDSIEVIIAGDTVPTESNKALFKNGNIEELFGSECIKLFEGADLGVINLETPLAPVDSPIDKYGPLLRADPDTITAIKKLGINLVSLANNHIRDQGDTGVKQTIQILKQEELNYIGAGENIATARKPFYFKKGNLALGIYAVCETEFSYASTNRPGANSLDMFESFRDIKDAKQKCDYLVVLFHGGKEEYRYPTPQEQRFARAMIDAGADVILAQHSHCIGVSEQYHSKFILYGQGNFIFDLCNDENWQTGLIVRLVFQKDDIYIEYIPVRKMGNKIRIATKLDANTILADMENRSSNCEDDGKVADLYRNVLDGDCWDILYMMGGRATSNKYFRWLDSMMKHKLILRLYNKRILLALLNTVQCETHREGLIDSITAIIKK